MLKDPMIMLHNIVLSLSDALDLVHPIAADHQQRVAYIALHLAKSLGCMHEEQAHLMYAASLHDIGILTLEEKIKAMNVDEYEDAKHAEIGSNLLKHLDLFSVAADIVRWHHQNHASEWIGVDDRVRLLSNMINLADYVDRTIRKDTFILHQVAAICERVIERAGKMFHPDLVDAFRESAKVEAFWLDIISPRIYSVLSDLIIWPQVLLKLEQLDQISSIFSRVVDFRSRFTATHSIGVATVAEQLAQRMCFEERECKLMRAAGYLHDLGKVSVPNAVLEKPGKLDFSEMNIMRAHTYFTIHILDTIGGFGEVSLWAALHHERMDGEGYPFHLKGIELPLGSRIMAVADVFTAISEDRPYRKGMEPKSFFSVLRNMVRSGALDGRIVEAFAADFEVIDRMRAENQKKYAEEFESQFSLSAS